VVSEPATIARREFDAMKFCTDAVPSIWLPQATLFINVYESDLLRSKHLTHKVGEEILAINYELSRSLFKLFHGKRTKESCAICKERNFTK
jgi:hypothetical protein